MQPNPREPKHKNIKEKLLDSIRKIVEDSQQCYLILVADHFALSLLDRLTTPAELNSLGIVLVLPLDDEKRPQKNYEVLYIIRPSISSLELIAQDFVNKDNRKYRNAHILALNFLIEAQLKVLRESKVLSQYLKTLREVSLDFLPVLSNAWSLDVQSSFGHEQTAATFDCIARRLCSVLTSYSQFYTFQFLFPQRLQNLANLIGQKLQKVLKILKEFGSPALNPKSLPIRLMIFDRMEDLQSPLLYSYFYAPMLFDVYRTDKPVINLDKQTYDLRPYRDPVFELLKNRSLGDIADDLAKETESIISIMENKEEFYKVIMELPQKYQLSKLLRQHLGILQQVNEKALGWMDLATMQQTLSTGISPGGKSLKDPELLDLMSKMFKNGVNVNIDEYARLYVILFLSVKLKQTELDDFEEPLRKSASYGNISSTLQKLQPQPRKLKEATFSSPQERRDVYRHSPAIITIYESLHNGQIPKDYLQRFVNKEGAGKRGLLTTDIQIREVLYCTTAIGFNEICLVDLMPKKKNTRLTLCSDQIMNPVGYLHKLIN